MKKRVLSFLMAFVVALSLIPILGGVHEVYAGSGLTRSDAVSWARAQNGRTDNCDVDGNGLWCTDLATAYMNYLWLKTNNDNRNPWGLYPYTTKMAYAYDDYVSGNNNWTVIARNSSTVPLPGDIFVSEQDSLGQGYGHVGIVLTAYGSSSAEIIQMSGGVRPSITTVTWGSTASYNPQYFIRFNYFLPDSTPTARLGIERKRYNPGDTVTFTFGGDNTNGTYTLGIYKELERYKTVNVTGSSYSIQLNDVASYSAYMTSYGTSGGYADSNWVDWQVLPLTAELSADKKKCNVNDKVTLSFKGNNNNTFANAGVTLAVWCNDEYVVHKNVSGGSYEVLCNKPGNYKSYMTAYGGGTYKDSNWVYWTVYPLTAELGADKTKCNVNDKVTLSFKGNNNNAFANGVVCLAVWCNDEYVVHKDVSGRNYEVVCSKPGNYKSYMTAFGGGTYKDSNWVYWTVYPLTAELSADKTKCNVNDKVTLSFKGNNSNAFSNGRITLAIWCDGEYVVHKDVTDKSYTVKCNKPGKYSSYMTAYGGGTYKDSNWVYWDVIEKKESIKKANPLKVKVSNVTFKRSKLKKAVKFSLGVSEAQGPVTYTVDKKAKKAGIIVSKKGKVLIPKKCKKGTYKITVKAAGNKNYKAGTKIVKIKVK